jgi:hypothetical protein
MDKIQPISKSSLMVGAPIPRHPSPTRANPSYYYPGSYGKIKKTIKSFPWETDEYENPMGGDWAADHTPYNPMSVPPPSYMKELAALEKKSNKEKLKAMMLSLQKQEANRTKRTRLGVYNPNIDEYLYNQI